MRTARGRGRTIIFVAVFLVAYLIAWTIIIYNMNDGYRTFRTLREKRIRLEQEHAMLSDRLEEIKATAEMRQADSPFFIEMVAREKLKMAKEGEVIIRMVEEDNEKP